MNKSSEEVVADGVNIAYNTASRSVEAEHLENGV